MREIETKELMDIQLQILDNVAEFCRQQNIKFWIDGGTLLGAVRHKGYIPWDDDIDVGMLREDYDRFKATYNGSELCAKARDGKRSKYEFHCPDNDESYGYCHGKVVDNDTVLYEPDENGRKLAVNIDIFVYDNAPADEKSQKSMFAYRDFCRRFSVARNQDHDVIGGWKRELVFRVLRLITLPFKANFFALKVAEASKKYANVETGLIGDFTSYTYTTCTKEVFESFVEVEFEGKKFPAPVGYDTYLKAFYGDYMQLPPEDKRVSTHVFKAYVAE